MSVIQNSITADLGSGSFAVDRLTKSIITVISEAGLAAGGFSRVVTGSRFRIVIEGRYGLARDGAFFDAMCAALRGSAVTNAVIDGVTYPSLYAERAVLSETDESGVGKFVITLGEL